MVKKSVMMFGVVAYVGQQCVERMPSMRLASDAMQFNVVGLRAAVDHCAEEQMALDVNHGRQLRKMMVLATGALAKVRRCVRRLQAGGINGSQLAGLVDQTTAPGKVDGGVKDS